MFIFHFFQIFSYVNNFRVQTLILRRIEYQSITLFDSNKKESKAHKKNNFQQMNELDYLVSGLLNKLYHHFLNNKISLHEPNLLPVRPVSDHYFL